jgi:hypothetical protein
MLLVDKLAQVEAVGTELQVALILVVAAVEL